MILAMTPLALAAIGGALAGAILRGRLDARSRAGRPERLIDWLLAESPLPLLVSNQADGRILKFNQHFSQGFGLEAAGLAGCSTVELGLLSPEYRTVLLECLAQQPIVSFNLRDLRVRHNPERFISSIITRISYRGSPALLTTFLRTNEYDQTVEERQLLSLAMEKLSEAVVITDQRGVIKYVNANFKPLTGMEPTDAVGRYLTSLTGMACSDNLLGVVLPTLKASGSWQGQHYIRDLHGRNHLLQANVTSINESGGLHYIVVGRDITETAELEQALAQAQRLEAIGTLTAGVAHDINNALMPIMGYAELCLDEIEPASRLRENLEIIMQSSQRCKEMVQHILQASRPRQAAPRPVRIQSTVRETVKLLRFSLPPTIEIVPGLDEHCHPVLIDPTQLYQVIMNLSTNAAQSMGEAGGNIFIYLTEIALDTPRPPLESLKPGLYAKLAVIDSGPGMPPDVRQRATEPFFSARGENGTGMGLYITNSIVTSHGGAITIDSQPGGGTAVNVYLPCAAGAEIPVPESEQPQGGREHLLIVDDEIFVGEMLKTMVSRLGYRITLAHSGQEALNLFRADPDSFDMLITDQGMPGMTGLCLAESLTRLRPGLPVIMITGGGENLDQGLLDRHGVRRVLHKPVALRLIAVAVRDEFDRGRA